MDRSAFRKRLRRMHRLLVDSRSALEKSSGQVRNKWLKDLLFMLACRRVIMLNTLDRELGILGQPLRPNPDAENYFTRFMGDMRTSSEPNSQFMNACEAEEAYLIKELGELMLQPGLSGRTRQMIADLLSSSQENLNDVRFLRGNLAALQV